MIVGVAEDTNWAWAAGVGSWEQAMAGRPYGRRSQAIAGGGRIIMRHEAPAGGGNPNYYQIGNF